MAVLDDKVRVENFEQRLQTRAQELVSLLDSGNTAGAMRVLAELSEARNTMLYQEVGRLTRGLHEAIKEFNVDIENSTALKVKVGTGQQDAVSDANERLQYVLQLTETAANTTMDKVEGSLPVVSELGEQARLLREDWKSMADSKATLAQVKDLGRTTETFLSSIEAGTNTVNSNLNEILLAQGFQDLTGQMITRVMSLVTEVESSLVNLVAVAGQVEKISGIDSAEQKQSAEADQASIEEEKKLVKGHGPQMNAETKDGVVADQDEVDDLLSSLGF